MRTYTAEIEIVRDGQEVLAEVTGTVEPMVRGRYFGRPENCYPDEGGYAEDIQATVDGKPVDLTDLEHEEAEAAVFCAYEDACDY